MPQTQPCRYQSAREFFEAARSAAAESARTERALERMRAAEGLRGASLAGGGARGRDPHAMGATDARMDFEAVAARRLSDDLRLLEAARRVIYGAGELGGGVAALLGSATADVLFMRCCRAMGWRAVADVVGQSVSWCKAAAGAAYDVCDAYGMEAMERGLGLAAA